MKESDFSSSLGPNVSFYSQIPIHTGCQNQYREWLLEQHQFWLL